MDEGDLFIGCRGSVVRSIAAFIYCDLCSGGRDGECESLRLIRFLFLSVEGRVGYGITGLFM